VIAREDGTPALLDLNGPTVRKAWVVIFDIPQRLYSFKGVVLVRRVRQPLTPEQNCALTQFARRQEGKHFATGRVLLQGTPFKAKNCSYFAYTPTDRNRWICSELMVSAACAAGILDPKVYPANAIYPRDLAYDEQIDISCAYEPAVRWCPCPHAPNP
jgi:hypothetical protein